MIILYVVLVVASLLFVARILLPEMAKPVVRPIAPKKENPLAIEPKEADNRIEKLEYFLTEKNKNIQLLQTELRIFHAQIRDFDKVKTLLETEIQHLREQNRMFRSELGLPTTVQLKENALI